MALKQKEPKSARQKIQPEKSIVNLALNTSIKRDWVTRLVFEFFRYVDGSSHRYGTHPKSSKTIRVSNLDLDIGYRY